MKNFAAIALSLAVAAPAAAATRNWTGTTSGNWSDPSNWGGTAPVAGDDLVFANAANANALNNDFPAGTLFNSLTFNAATTFSPQGNGILLGPGGITQTSGTTLNSFLPVTLAAPQTWTGASPGGLVLNLPATVALGANTLTILGSGSHAFSGNTITGTGGITLGGSVTVTFTGNMNYTGPTTVGGTAHLNLQTPAAIATPIVVGSGGFLDDAVGFSGFLNAPLTIAAGGTYDVVINGTAILQYSKVTVNVAPITLGGSLAVTNNLGAAPLGTVFTIILNQSGSPVAGTFAGLPEGATFVAGGQTFRVSYVGGGGRDVTLTAVSAAPAPTTTTVTSSPNPSSLGQSVTFTATVAPTATGVVSFFDGVTLLGTGTLNGSSVATFTTSALANGPHSITAVYAGDTTHAGSTSPVLSQVVGAAAIVDVPALDARALAALAAALAAAALLRLKR